MVMTTLIQCSNSSGIYGRCDAKCYGAHWPDCDCVCGGMNHGKGYEAARDNTAALAGERLRAIEARGGYVPDEFRQLGLL